MDKETVEKHSKGAAAAGPDPVIKDRGPVWVWTASLVGLALIFAWGIWKFGPSSQPSDHPDLGLTRLQAKALAEIPLAKFTDVTVESGVKFVHNNGAYGDKLLPETMGGGVAFLDFDNDGKQDLLFVNSAYWPWHEVPNK